MALPVPYYQDDAVTIYHGDCRAILPELPEVDLVLMDPPYGIGENAFRVANRAKLSQTRDYGRFDWDKQPWEQALVDKCIAKGRQATVWGGNYYAMAPSSCWLVWDKVMSGGFADCELAWTNFKKAVRMKKYVWAGFRQQIPEERFHPTQKPLQVITWAISMADEPALILDPCMGSGTTLRAAKDLGRKAIGIELEERYCEIAARRMSQEVLL